MKLVSSTRSFAKDVQGTVEGLEDPDGTSDKNERYALDPYGALENENQLSAEAKANPVRFQGFTYDSASDLYDMQARHYRPEVGRFLTRDRYESSALDVNLEQDPLTNNMYAFAGGNPVNGVEWDGHCSNNAQVQWGLTNGVVVKCLTDRPGTNGGTAHGPATAPPVGYSAPPGVTTPFSAPKPAPGAPADMSSYASMNVQFARPLPGPGLMSKLVKNWIFDEEQCEHDVDYDAVSCGVQMAGLVPGLGIAGKGAGKAGKLGRVWRWIAGEKRAVDPARMAPKGRFLQRFNKRRGYVYEVNAIKGDVEVLTAMGVGRDEIAEFALNRRNQLKRSFRKATPAPGRMGMAWRNNRKYGNPIGRSYEQHFDWLLQGGYSPSEAFESIIESASRTSDRWYLK